jgi:hypothetical protein
VAKLNSELVPLNSKEDRQGKAINLLKGELAADVDAMKAVYDQDPAAYPDIKDDPKLVTDVKKQGKAGADRIKSQDLDSLKGSG